MISILETYQPPPLSENVGTNIHTIIEEVEKELGVYQTLEKRRVDFCLTRKK